MNLDLRQAIAERVQGKSEAELSETINSSVDGEEQALPGLGVLLEMIWKQSDTAQKQQMAATLHQHLQTS